MVIFKIMNFIKVKGIKIPRRQIKKSRSQHNSAVFSYLKYVTLRIF